MSKSWLLCFYRANNITLLANTPTQAKSQLYSLEQAAGGIVFHMNSNKMEYMCCNWKEAISTLNGRHLKLVDKFMYLGSSVSFIESDVSEGMDCYQ